MIVYAKSRKRMHISLHLYILIIVTLTITEHPETGAPLIAVEEGGLHAAKALIIARYLMLAVYNKKPLGGRTYHLDQEMFYYSMKFKLANPLLCAGCSLSFNKEEVIPCWGMFSNVCK